jgi:hypothetical protein
MLIFFFTLVKRERYFFIIKIRVDYLLIIPLSGHLFSLKFDLINFLIVSLFCKMISSIIPQWVSQDSTYLCHPPSSRRWFWMEFESILVSLLSSMLLNLFLYNRYVIIVFLSMGERLDFKRRIG